MDPGLAKSALALLFGCAALFVIQIGYLGLLFKIHRDIRADEEKRREQHRAEMERLGRL